MAITTLSICCAKALTAVVMEGRIGRTVRLPNAL